MAAGHLDATAVEGKFLSHLAHACTAGHDRDKEGCFCAGIDILTDGSVFLTALEGIENRPSPDTVDRSDSFAKPLVKGGHLHRKIADRAAVEQESALGVLLLNALQKASEDLAQDRNGIVGVAEGIYPPVVHSAKQEFVENGIPEFILPGEVMEERALGDAGRSDNAVETPALESVSVEFTVAGFEYLAAGPFGIAQAGHGGNLHTSRNVASGGRGECLCRGQRVVAPGPPGEGTRLPCWGVFRPSLSPAPWI